MGLIKPTVVSKAERRARVKAAQETARAKNKKKLAELTEKLAADGYKKKKKLSFVKKKLKSSSFNKVVVQAGLKKAGAALKKHAEENEKRKERLDALENELKALTASAAGRSKADDLVKTLKALQSETAVQALSLQGREKALAKREELARIQWRCRVAAIL